MVKQYPHYLYVLVCDPSARDGNGDFIPGRKHWELHSMCREETNGKGQEVITADLKAYKFSSLIQMPRNTERVTHGTRVVIADKPVEFDEQDIKRLVDAGTIRISGVCAKFSRDQLHCRLWL